MHGGPQRIQRLVNSAGLLLQPGEAPPEGEFLLLTAPVPAIRLERGDRLVQSDLANTLERIAAEGESAFYGGDIAGAIAAEMRANGGIITTGDLADYRAIEREAVHGTYRGHDIYAMPPPSSGGVHLVQILNLIEAFPIAELGHNSARTVHLLAESMKLAYADRAEHLGDPGFWPVPVEGLTSKAYAEHLRARIRADIATPSAMIRAGRPQDFESEQTTHFSVMDAAGGAVSNTYTLNFSYGSAIVAPGTGVLPVADPGTLGSQAITLARAVESSANATDSHTLSMAWQADGPPHTR